MAESNPRIRDVNISQEMRNSFLDYAMSVIVSRALPDVRDGLKPVHRRILYAMNELGITPDKPYKKSARIVGEVIGKYHPHGDAAVYDTLVRMAQDFSYRYMLVDGHGNFGSVDGDAAAAMRYTEARMSKISTELLRDINKDTIDFGPNYDGEEKEPLVLPARFPNLLVNGTSGIAVGMATNIPPHNLGEVIDGVVHLIDHPDATLEDVCEWIKGPDFPTGAQILGKKGIRRAYATGHGSIVMRAKAFVEEARGGKSRIVVEEIPYQVNKARLIEKIAELVREKKIEDITDLRDESDREGLRIVIELRRDANPQVVLNNLYKQTALQMSYGINMLALVDGQPQVMNLKEVLTHYLEHQKVVIRRRTQFELDKAEARAHILEGLRVALDHLDEVITLIRSSRTTEEAKAGLINRFELSEKQAQAILDMRLQRLTGLEREKIESEYQELLQTIARLREILADEQKILGVIREELLEIKAQYADERRTQITVEESEIDVEDLIPEEEVAVLLTHNGYTKRLPLSTYRSQKRGGRGVSGMGTKEDDFVEHLIITNSHNYIMFFSNRGKVYRLKAYEVPEMGRAARGTPIINLIQIEQGEYIEAVIPVKDFDRDRYLFFATRHGIVKKTALGDFANIRKGGLFAINLRNGDELIDVRLTDGSQEIIIGTAHGQSIRFPEQDVRTMGRTATGVKGITLNRGDHVVGMDIVKEDANVLVVTENGYGKRTPMHEYRVQTRGGKGIKTLNVTDRNGPVIGLKVMLDDDDLMIVTEMGVIIRQHVNGISVMGRYTQGVKLISMRADEKVGTIARVEVTDNLDNGV
ncbi:DNA gyrase subunit A [Novibacillus thermophilus]|uniref:DNA gyrase subunit A n=1 Tax=Novibacillus thermophilus TaxID=1471761 RepID=A0A1U9K300_9BACL|nr:DNA gyrase subunit A [Novibacillus thermophilus]AQS54429.1 DNA gyrase subunit A [Novibacillus thermophilus]